MYKELLKRKLALQADISTTVDTVATKLADARTKYANDTAKSLGDWRAKAVKKAGKVLENDEAVILSIIAVDGRSNINCHNFSDATAAVFLRNLTGIVAQMNLRLGFQESLYSRVMDREIPAEVSDEAVKAVEGELASLERLSW